MMHRFDPRRLLMQYASHKGLPFWGLGKRDQLAEGTDFQYDKQFQEELSLKGTRLRYKDALGRWVFMPVVIEAKVSYELPYAIMNISSKKSIVETALVGGVGSVKELISTGDYNISITAVLVGQDGKYPETEIEAINSIWKINEPVELISVFTDIIFDENDKVVIKHIGYPSMQGIEDAQIVTLECVTDKPFELYVV